MKNANGAGCVSRCKDKRRKPWKVIITKGFVYDEDSGSMKQQRKVVGYYRTKRDAEDALSSYRQNPYDLDGRKITLADLYEKWNTAHFEKISASAVRGYKAAYNHMGMLQRMKFTAIRPAHIEQCLAESGAGSATKGNMRKLLNQIYRYAIKNEICSTNYAAMCDSIEPDAPKIVRSPISEEEERVLWEKVDTTGTDMILINMYSGWRPSELLSLKVEDVDLKEGIMYGGMKTKAGKDRAVPIHRKIMKLVEKRYNAAKESGSEYLFRGATKKEHVTYGVYRVLFTRVSEMLGSTHRPHDARHTFVTKAKEAGVNEWILKLIVGHTVRDITEKVYTHRRLSELKSEMEKIP